jgi:hypothetical protein
MCIDPKRTAQRLLHELKTLGYDVTVTDAA